ncbi:MAG: hypothetical protein QNI84_15095 [Henriciella sp.]|nr:hypothetical protein [Henriciella sp.]
MRTVRRESRPTFEQGEVIDTSSPTLNLDLALLACDQISLRLNHLANAVVPGFSRDIFYTRSRVKSKQSIFEKEARKSRESKEEPPVPYSYRDMTDLVGFRIVTLYDAGLERTIDFILAMIEAGASDPNPLFSPLAFGDTFQEADFYTRSDMKRKDVYSRCEQKLHGDLLDRISAPLDGHKKLNRHAVKKFLTSQISSGSKDDTYYSSGRMIFQANAFIDDKVVRLPIEIQVRAAIEDIWAEINHKALYKLQAGPAWNVTSARHIREMEQRSDSLKRAFDMMSESMTTFGENAEDAKNGLRNFRYIDGDLNKENEVEKYFKNLFISYHFFKAGDVQERRYIKLFDTYSKLASGLPDGSQSQIFSRILDCEAALEKIKKEVVSDLNKSFGSDLLKVKDTFLSDRVRSLSNQIQELDRNEIIPAELSRQRFFILEFERIRLKALKLLVGDDGVVKLVASDLSESKKEALSKIFKTFCSLTEIEEFQVKSMTVVYFWKHMMMFHLNQDAAFDFLARANDTMKQDPSLPEGSIYRVLVQRERASREFSKCHEIVSVFDPDALKTAGINLLGDETQSPEHDEITSQDTESSKLPKSLLLRAYGLLERAFAYSLNAWECKIENGRSNGDLCFGLTDLDQVIDASTCQHLREYSIRALSRDPIKHNKGFAQRMSQLNNYTRLH